jgi:hypothetical protein
LLDCAGNATGLKPSKTMASAALSRVRIAERHIVTLGMGISYWKEIRL